MGSWLEEVRVVLSYSTKTQLAIALGIFFFLGITAMGQLLVGGLELHGPLAAVTNILREKLMHRYDKAAWLAFGAFALLAVKTYRMDRRRLLGF